MIQDLFIVVAETVAGKIRVLYSGKDAAASDRAFVEADDKNGTVSEIAHVFPVRTRYPAEEAAQMQASAQLSDDQAAASAAQAQRQADKLRADAQALLEQADKLSPPTATATAN